MSSTYRPRITGNHMQTYFGKNVILLCQYVNIEPSGKRMSVKSCDDQTIWAFLKQPQSNMIEPNTWIEIEGKVKGKTAIEVEKFDMPPAQLFENFDAGLYCEMVNTLLHPTTRNNYIIEDKTEHHGSGPEVELVNQATSNGADSEGGFAGEESFLNL